MSYYFDEKEKAIFENHTINKPIRVSCNVEETISYLNQLYKMDTEKINLLDRLLAASLTGIVLGKIQDEAAKMLRYPGIDGYIKEKFKKSDIEICNCPSYGMALSCPIHGRGKNQGVGKNG